MSVALPCHAAGATRIPAADFFNNPDFSGAKLSPSGRYLAAKRVAQNGREQLAVVDLVNTTAASVAIFKDADVGNFAWISDERLLFDTTDKQIGQRELRYGPGLYAVNRDGQSFRQLARHNNPFFRFGDDVKDLLPWHTFMLDQDGAQDSEQVYVENINVNAPGDYDHVELLKLNTRTLRHTTVEGPGDTRGWLLDAQGEPRIALTIEGNQQVLHYREPKDGKWRKVASADIFKGGQGYYEPLAFGSDGTLYVRTSTSEDKGVAAVHTMNLETGVISQKPLVRLDGYDFKGKLIFSQGKLLGVRFVADGEGTQWFDAGMQAIQQEIDAKLPRTANVVTPPVRAETPYLLVEAYSDRQPRAYFIYDKDKKTLNLAGHSHPNIKPSQMGAQDLQYYAARDGMRIPVWLTKPAGADKNLPMVVLVHGGPYARGSQWGWHPESQFLASRGYAVLEPEFRGSEGYGYQHFRAGWKQWGLKMQDDIADGVKWAIAQGIADPKRICIAGASYGGYAAMMGLVNDPGLFQCGVNWVGVTDINLMFTGHWRFTSDFSPLWKKYGMPELVGDPVTDAEQFKATSPLQQAARISQPLLLAYGGADMRVPIIHGTKFRDAVSAANKQVEWIEYSEEGHGWALPKNRIDFWTRVEKFLDKHIGGAAASSATTTQSQ
ncbi:alpha/beta hydrolase family protein [Pseudoduganella ginsengisoli]|uniref:alpha/beta hydrolase family protein n=1 Tax=Pseudoduganella ginsengisoli TaxID=1462440 RepID=UPI001E316C0D|nr:alpha/beta fold hydrolase [Pseudoduganella ginsengisoli]